jgi:signal transduction histidine kinase
MTNLTPDLLIKPVRQRLFVLLLQAFVIVVLMIILLMFGSVIFLLNRMTTRAPLFKPTLAAVLESYYQGHGSWEGVESITKIEIPTMPNGISSEDWKESILLDQSGYVILKYGKVSDPKTLYPDRTGQFQVPLYHSGQQVGALLIPDPPIDPNLIEPILLPLGLTSAFLAILTVLIGLLLTWRIIKPLAEVIVAAGSVSSGNLKTRVKVQGSGDLRVLIDSFNQMAATLERNDREQRDLVAVVAHELRTPLSILQGKLEGIIDDIYPADKKNIQPALDETYLLERLIEDLDTLSQAEAHELHFSREPIQLEQLAIHIIDNLKAQAVEKKINIKVNKAQNLPSVFGDPQRISQVISNLVNNAIRYIPERGIIDIIINNTPEGVELSVNDNGPGIPIDDIPYIFDRFWRAEKSRSRVLGGTGLGLAIARQFIEIQGGRIWAKNLPGGGFQVGFVLPY